MNRELGESELVELRRIEYPPSTPDLVGIQAIEEVWSYLVEYREAAKQELWEELVLNTDRDSAGRELCRKWGYVPAFQDRWWNRVIIPGLRILDDVEPVDGDDERWRFVSDK